MSKVFLRLGIAIMIIFLGIFSYVIGYRWGVAHSEEFWEGVLDEDEDDWLNRQR